MHYPKQQAPIFLMCEKSGYFQFFQIEQDDAKGFDVVLAMDYIRKGQVLETNPINSEP